MRHVNDCGEVIHAAESDDLLHRSTRGPSRILTGSILALAFCALSISRAIACAWLGCFWSGTYGYYAALVHCYYARRGRGSGTLLVFRAVGGHNRGARRADGYGGKNKTLQVASPFAAEQ